MITSGARWPFTFDQTIALAIGVPGTVAAIIAAIFAVRADWFVRKDSAADAALRDLDIQPRLHERWGGYAGTPAHLELMNVGGSAAHFIWVGHDDRFVGAASGPIGPHTPAPVVYRVTELGQSPHRAGRGTTLLTAQDVQARWWDCRTGILLPMQVEVYLAKRMQQVGLAELEEQLRLGYLPRRMPAESLQF